MQHYDLRVLIHHSWSDEDFPYSNDGHGESIQRLVELGMLDADKQITPAGVDHLACVNRSTAKLLPEGMQLNSMQVCILLHQHEDERPFTVERRSQRSAVERLHSLHLLDEDGVTPQGREQVERISTVEFFPAVAPSAVR